MKKLKNKESSDNASFLGYKVKIRFLDVKLYSQIWNPKNGTPKMES